MAERPGVKEILEIVRRGGPAQPTGAEAEAQAEPEAAEAEPVAEAEAVAPEEAAPPAPTAASLGRPLTLQEKLAAARAGAAPKPAAPAKPAAQPKPAAAAPATPPAAAPAPPAAPLGRPLTLQEKLAAARGGGAAPAAAAPSTPAPAAPAAPLGRPMTMQEKLAAARGGAAPAPAAGAKPAAAKPAAGAAPAAKPAAARALPPLEKLTDPKDLAEAARQAGAKAQAASVKTAPGAPAKPGKAAKEKKAEVATVPPKPKKGAAAAAGGIETSRRGFVMTVPAWIVLGWATFTAGMAALTAACGRFMFPNVLAEPPSTIKVGVPSNFEPESVSERWKAEWGFWIVRSSRYSGQDIIYAIQSVCTHLGCPPNWLGGEQKFKCPCHGSGFYITGVNFEGPAPRPLERFKVSLADDGQLMVDKSQKYQEEMGQWTDPDSFVPV